MNEWQERLKTPLINKLKEALSEFSDKELVRLDIGVFPWHSSIELSFLFTGDSGVPEDIASWDYYNYSDIYEGKWDEIKGLCEEMSEEYQEDEKSEKFFVQVAEVFRTPELSSVVHSFTVSPDFSMTLCDPDNFDSQNYIEA